MKLRTKLATLAVLSLPVVLPTTGSATELDLSCDFTEILPAHTKPVVWEVTSTNGDLITGFGKGRIPVSMNLTGTGSVTLRTGSYSQPDKLGTGRTLTADFECPTPAPVPPTPEVVPQPTPPAVVVPPSNVVPPKPKPKPKPPLRGVKREIVVRAVPCKLLPDGTSTRSYSIRKTKVVWTRAGKVVRTKSSRTYRVYGGYCPIPPVAG